MEESVIEAVPHQMVLNGTLGCTFCEESFEGPRIIKLEPGENGGLIQEVISCDSCKDTYGKSYWILISRDRKEFKCSSCNKAAPTQRSINNHFRKEHILKPTYRSTCETCGKEFNKEQLYKIHIKRHVPKTIACELCDGKFTSKTALRAHSRTHTKPYACNLCDERFGQKPQLDNHLRIHAGIKLPRIKCTLCDKTFSKKTHHLTFHMATAHGVGVQKINKFQCKLCSQKFSNTGSLNEHMRGHTGEKPFACSICNKKYSTLHSRAAHIRISHTNEKGFKCSRCDKCFTSKCGMEVHIRRAHTFERPFQCKLCSWNFTARETLRRHMLSHTQERAHKCTICEASFTQCNGLSRHMLIHTKKGSTRKRRSKNL